jgi:uncharacterized protein YydD (DUF2326 family)
MTNEEYTASVNALLDKCEALEARMDKLEIAIKQERNLAFADIRRQAIKKLNALRQQTGYYNHENH